MSDLIALSPDVVLAVVGYLVLANLLALLVARTPDAADGAWQSADSRLLFLAAMGGWAGAKLGLSAFHRQGPGGSFRKVLDLSILVLPAIVAIPVLMAVAPGLVSQGYAAYAAHYDQTQAETDARISPLGTASGTKVAARATDASGVAVPDAKAVVAATAADSSQAVSAVETAATTPATASVLPKRFGPGSDVKAHKTSQKTLSIGK